ncbi:MAG: regulatory protein RecX [Chlamydiales bacterium]|nr:regulatory protein RecX [Chlamydiia bacterium]MCP5506965.1 regulatory protein RecX [Chlamydiales bacterium]
MPEVKCLPHPQYREVITILVDEEPWRDVHTKIFGKNFSLPASYPTVEAFQEAFHGIERKNAFHYVMNRLAARDYSSYELTKLLSSCNISDSIQREILEECSAYGYINDEQWIDNFIAGQIRKKKGPQAIICKLQEKGVPQEYAQQKVEGEYQQGAQDEEIQHLLANKYKNRDLTDFKEKQKTISALVRRGFPLHTVLEALES